VTLPVAEASSFNEINNAETYKDKKVPIFSLASKLPLLPQGVVDAAAGYGDGVSFGLTQWVREKIGTDNVVDKNSNIYNASLLAGVLTPQRGLAWVAEVGWELKVSNNLRIAFLGNRTGYDKKGNILMRELPHYHRRGAVQGNVESEPGQGIGRHRPWEVKETDTSFWDRF